MNYIVNIVLILGVTSYLGSKCAHQSFSQFGTVDTGAYGYAVACA